MGKPATPRNPRRRIRLSRLVRWLMVGCMFLLAMVVAGGLALYQVGKAFAELLLTGLAQVAAGIALVITAMAGFLLLFLAMVLLQTPPHLIPFGPAARLIHAALLGWLGTHGS